MMNFIFRLSKPSLTSAHSTYSLSFISFISTLLLLDIFSKNDSIREYIAKSACKSAVKGKDKLSNNEIEYLLNQINKDGQVLLCPHGRPIVVSISEKEIEKWFKRIV